MDTYDAHLSQTAAQRAAVAIDTEPPLSADDLAEVASLAAAHPGQWVELATPYTAGQARAYARQIRELGLSNISGDFDAEAFKADGSHRIRVRSAAPLLTQAEMDRAINDTSDPYHLSYAEQARVINRLIPIVPVEVAAALCATWKERTP